jgi:hypothetical protein
MDQQQQPSYRYFGQAQARLPSPSQLHLPHPGGYSRTNTLPPISSARYPPPSFPPHPSLSSPTQLPPISPPPPPSTNGWPVQQQQQQQQQQQPQQPQHHQPSPQQPQQQQRAAGPSRTRDEPQSASSASSRSRRDSVKREQVPHVLDHPSAQPEDAMASTSDFVKKLYK